MSHGDYYYDPRDAYYYPHPRLRSRTPPAPPRPTEPDAATIRSTFSDTFTLEHTYRGLTFATLEELKYAVAVYAGEASSELGRTASAQESGVGAVLLLTVLGRGVTDFLARLVAELDAWYDSDRALFQEGWDYDGPGPFHKTTLYVERIDRGLQLRFDRAYTGSACEKELAKKLGWEHDYVGSQLAPTWATDGPRWAIPVSFFVALDAAIYGGPVPTPPKTAFEMLYCLHEESTLDRWEEPRAVLAEEGGLRYAFNLTSYRKVPHYKLVDLRAGAKTEASRLALAYDYGPVTGLSGPARKSERWSGRYEAIGAEVFIKPVDRADAARARAAADAFATYFGDLLPAYPQEY